MQIPKGITIDTPGDWVLQVKKNIYGQKQAGRVWNQHLVKILTLDAMQLDSNKATMMIVYSTKEMQSTCCTRMIQFWQDRMRGNSMK